MKYQHQSESGAGNGHNGNGNGNGHSAHGTNGNRSSGNGASGNGLYAAGEWRKRIEDDPNLFYKIAPEPRDLPSGASHDTAGVELVANIDFPTRYGNFTLYGFLERAGGFEHTAIVKGDVRGVEHCPVRVHSECHTGDVWGSLRCDCREQLEFALRYLGSAECGAIVYMRQEGRGIGLLNKLKAYRLQDLGLDTVEANHALGYPAEARDYRVTAAILNMLGVSSVELMSNNPDKIEKLSADGVRVVGRIPVVTAPTEHNRFYLNTKKAKMGHLY